MNYNAINAKVKAMKRHLLKYEDYEMLSMLGSVEEVGQKLMEYPAYHDVLSQLEGVEIHRNLLEHKINMALADDFSRIYNFIGDYRTRKYLNAFFLSFEIQIINILLCMVYDERDIPYSIPEMREIFGDKLNIDVSKLMKSKTVSELIDNLQGTYFYSMLVDVYKKDDSSLFKLEMQLDLFYYMHLWRLQKKYLDKKNLVIMERIKGIEVDLRNIMWVYRLKKFYNIEASQIYAYLIPINYKLKISQLSRMAEAATEEILMNEIQQSPYGTAFSDFTQIEQVFYREMFKEYRKAEATNPSSLAVTVGYMYHKEVELKNITALLECVRYKMTPEQIMGYLYEIKK